MTLATYSYFEAELLTEYELTMGIVMKLEISSVDAVTDS